MVCALLLSACQGGDREGGEARPPGPDASSVPDATEPQDAAQDTSPPVEDAQVSDAQDSGTNDGDGQDEPGFEWTALELGDGQVARGELLKVFDHNIWWAPEARMTFALFDGAGFADYPDDRSVRLIDAAEVTRAWFEPAPSDAIRYSDFAVQQGVVLRQPPLEGLSHVLTAHESYHLEEYGYGDFAWDLVVTDEVGRRFEGDGSRNEDYLVWDREVFLPTGGWVIEVERDAPDNSPGQWTLEDTNNLVGVALGGHYYLYLLHFRQGTIPFGVQEGTYLEQGAYLGRVGNSGVSHEPHLHVAVVWYDVLADPPRSWAVPVKWADLEVSPSPHGPFEAHGLVEPPSKAWLRPAP